MTARSGNVVTMSAGDDPDVLLGRLERAAANAERARADRDVLIAAAIAAGATQRAVAAAAGMSHPGVAKVAARVAAGV